MASTNTGQRRRLHNASQQGDVRKVRKFLREGDFIDCLDQDGNTPLICAAVRGHRDCVKTLIDAGASLNHKSGLHVTPLLAASQEGHHECAYLLIAAGADVSATGPGGLTILQLASGHGHTDFIEVLLSSGADPNFLGGNEDYMPLENAAYMGNLKAVQLLLDAGADIDRRNNKGWSLLHHPIKSLDVLKLLLKRGASAKYLDRTGASVLHNAGYYGAKTPIIMALYGAGADPTIVDNDGETAADVARGHGHEDTAILLDMLAAKYRKTKGVSSSEEKKDTAPGSNDKDATNSYDSKGKLWTKESVLADMEANFRSFGLGGKKSEAKKESKDEYKEERQSVAAASAPCVNCGDMTVRLCSGCETTRFCTKKCEMAARHVCCG